MTTKKRTPPRAKTVKAYIAAAPPDKRRLLKALRRLVRETAPDVEEAMRWGRPVFTHDGELLCYLDKARHHVSLGFFHGARLRDPRGLLEGSGSKLRAIKVRSKEDIEPTVFARLVREAVRFAAR